MTEAARGVLAAYVEGVLDELEAIGARVARHLPAHREEPRRGPSPEFDLEMTIRQLGVSGVPNFEVLAELLQLGRRDPDGALVLLGLTPPKLDAAELADRRARRKKLVVAARFAHWPGPGEISNRQCALEIEEAFRAYARDRWPADRALAECPAAYDGKPEWTWFHLLKLDIELPVPDVFRHWLSPPPPEDETPSPAPLSPAPDTARERLMAPLRRASGAA